MSTAAVIVIGEEILSGKFADENAPWLTGRLRALGVRLRHVAVIGDDIALIAEEVARLSSRVEHVFTTGGVGPTHDDRTFEGVAMAFGVPLVERHEVLELLRRYGMPDDAMVRRMATLPEGAELVVEDAQSFPVVRVRNVWVLPGVPRIMRQKFEALAPRLAGSHVAVARVYADDHEHAVAAFLAGVQATWPDVEIGSYPRYGEPTGRLIVTLEGADEALVIAATHAVAAGLAVRRVVLPGELGG